MLFKIIFKYLGMIAAAAVILSAPASAKSAANWVAEGNRAFDAERFDDAVAAYDKALAESPGEARILFNKACALYMKKDYELARDLFEQAALKAGNASLEAKSHFNMGNAEFKQSNKPAESDMKNRLEVLERSIAHYEKALALEPEMEAAAHNLEMARATLQQIQKQQEAAERQKKQRQEMQEQLQDLIDQQKALSSQTQEMGKQGNDFKKGDEAGNGKEALAREQAAIKDKTRDLSERMTEANGEDKEDPTDKARSHLSEALDNQEKAEDKLNQSEYPDAQKAQEKAAEAMERALSELKDKDKGQSAEDQDDNGEQAPQETAAPAQASREPERTGRNKADGMGTEDPEKILEEEFQNRRQRQITSGGNYRPVEKDW